MEGYLPDDVIGEGLDHQLGRSLVGTNYPPNSPWYTVRSLDRVGLRSVNHILLGAEYHTRVEPMIWSI